MYFSYGLLALALILILLTKKDEKTTDNCHMPTHHHEHHEEELQEMGDGKVANKKTRDGYVPLEVFELRTKQERLDDNLRETTQNLAAFMAKKGLVNPKMKDDQRSLKKAFN